MKRWKLIILGVLILFIVIVAVGVGGYIYIQDSYNFTSSKDYPSLEKIELLDVAFDKVQKINIALLGVDERKDDPGRSDAIIIVSLDLVNKKVNILSIPRDTRVLIPGKGYNKINHAYAYGGVNLSLKTIEDFLGIPIHYYAKVNFQDFEKLIDGLGGVDIEVEKRMYYRDKTDKFLVDLSPGVHHLNGKEALGYVRFRHDIMGDLSRIERQQKFLKALFKQVKEKVTLLNLPQYVSLAGSTLETNVSLLEGVFIGSKFLNITEDDINTMVLPGTPETIDGISYVIPDEIKIRALVNENFKLSERKEE
ncbi:MAG TPA: LCP family protein [Dictyoglomaceae bacterium]|nr:LCP family protein [Dictyoglomaceae bacterium]HOL39432.1 LCP family protein [Dictyoglomaceae bacterium]HOP95530.1 LCP family protein [Dictyoglomaceae bacterium]HPP16375.1 LCP family protein [Dictyoglomaceae bacterium]HPU43491.1 LCP family protein [Dictyoglomaceae bacterium]